MRFLFFLSTCLSMGFFSAAIFAQSRVPDIAFSGFASVVYAQTVTDDNEEKPTEGMSNEPDFEYFNRLGLRLDADLANDLNFTLQMVANGSMKYDPKVDWAFLSYNATPGLKFSAGKLRLPLYMYSEYKDVSYAYQWIVPPWAVYGAPDFENFNGVKADYMMNLGGEWSSTLEAWTGRLDDFVELGGIGGRQLQFHVEDMFGIALNLDRDWLRFRLMYLHSTITSDLSPVFESSPVPPALSDAFQSVGLTEDHAVSLLSSISMSDAVTLDNDSAHFMAMGATMDFGRVFFNAEATYIHTDPNVVVGRAVSWYALAGLRGGNDLTYSLTFSRDINRPNKQAADDFGKDYLAVASLQGLPDSFAAAIYPGVEHIFVDYYATYVSNAVTLTTRWDFHPKASLKAEYFYKNQTQFGEDTEPQAIRLGMDLVF